MKHIELGGMLRLLKTPWSSIGNFPEARDRKRSVSKTLTVRQLIDLLGQRRCRMAGEAIFRTFGLRFLQLRCGQCTTSLLSRDQSAPICNDTCTRLRRFGSGVQKPGILVQQALNATAFTSFYSTGMRRSLCPMLREP